MLCTEICHVSEFVSVLNAHRETNGKSVLSSYIGSQHDATLGSGACRYPPEPALRQSCCARGCALAPVGDMDRKAAVIDGKDRRTDGHPTVAQTLHRILCGLPVSSVILLLLLLLLLSGAEAAMRHLGPARN